MKTDPYIDLFLRLAEGLHVAGAPAHRLEALLKGLAESLDLPLRVFSTPTAIYASFGPIDDARTVLMSAGAPSLDLGKLCDVGELVDEVVSGATDVRTATSRLGEMLQRASPYSRWATLLAFSLTSAAAAVLFGGGVGEMAGALLAGAAVGALGEFMGHRPRIRPVFQLAGAVLAGVVAGLWSAVVPADPQLVTVAALIALVPGLSLTTATTELATGHLSSGTARLAGALVSFACLAMGTTVAHQLTGHLSLPLAPVSLGAYATIPAVGLASVTFVVLMRARSADLVWVMLATSVAWVSNLMGSWMVGPIYGAAIAAFVLTLVANAAAHARRQPAAILLVPGMFLLVPGSVGLRGLSGLYSADVMGGLESAVAAGLMAVALATGVLVAHAVLPPRRVL